MRIEGQYVYFTGSEGNDHFLPKVRDRDERNVPARGEWVDVSFSDTFTDHVNYRRPLQHLTAEQSAVVNQHCNPQPPAYEHYL